MNPPPPLYVLGLFDDEARLRGYLPSVGALFSLAADVGPARKFTTPTDALLHWEGHPVDLAWHSLERLTVQVLGVVREPS